MVFIFHLHNVCLNSRVQFAGTERESGLVGNIKNKSANSKNTSLQISHADKLWKGYTVNLISLFDVARSCTEREKGKEPKNC